MHLDISSRSESVNANLERRRGAGRIPPCGASWIQLLHAAVEAPVYAIAAIDVKDTEGYTKEFLPKTQPGIKASGGEYVAGGMNKTTRFDGEKPPSRVVIIKWPNMEAWNKFENSDAGKKAREELGHKFGDWKALWVVEGVDPK
jgi:uncharacterized protein (DUF1330 family)